MTTGVPQPAVDRMVPFAGHTAVVGVIPDQPALVTLTALAWARAVHAPHLHFAYADPGRYVVSEHSTGRVKLAVIDPDSADDQQATTDLLTDQVARALGEDCDVPWTFHYLAGRPDRALTHLARAVDAAVLVVGTRPARTAAHITRIMTGSVSARLAHHQHRPVLTVPLTVVDWAQTAEGAW